MISFSLSNFGSDDVNFVVKLSDGADSADAGYLQIDVSVVPTVAFPNTGDINGLFVGFGDDNDAATILALNAPSTTTGGAWYGADVTELFSGGNGGCNNLNGAGGVPASSVDLGFTLGVCGSSSGLLTSSTVFLQGLEIGDLNAIGGRVQTVGLPPNGGGGSSKVFLGTIPPPPGDEEVPEPATLTLMGAGLLGLIYFRRSRN